MGLNLCWVQIRATLSVWLQTKRGCTANPYCINLKDQTPLSASERLLRGASGTGINLPALVQAVTYDRRIQTWPCDVAAALLCLSGSRCHLMGVLLAHTAAGSQWV